MAMEAFVEEGLGNLPGIVHEKLCLDAMDTRRLLERRNHMGNQLYLELLRVAVIGQCEEVSHNAFAALVHKERIAFEMTTFHGSIAGQNLGVTSTPRFCPAMLPWNVVISKAIRSLCTRAAKALWETSSHCPITATRRSSRYNW